MKNIKICIYLLGISLLVLSCNDPRRDNMTPSMIYMANSGLQTRTIYDVGQPQTINVSVVRSGIENVDATATVEIMADEVAKYNEENATNYVILPENCYTFQKANLNIVPDKQYANTSFVINLVELNKLADISKYVLPIGVTEGSFEINKALKVSFYTFVVKPAIISMNIQGTNIQAYDPTSTATTLQVPMTLLFDNLWDIEATLTTNQEVFEEFVAKYDAIYEMMPTDAYTITDVVTFAKGESRKSFTVVINQTKLGGSRYVIPIKLTSTKANADVSIFPDPDKNLLGIVVSADKGIQLPSSSLKIDSYSSIAPGESIGTIEALTDGILTTYWHSSYSGDFSPAPPTGPQPWFVVDLGSQKTVTDIMLAPRISSSNTTSAGYCNDGYFEVSNDNVNWVRVGKFSVAAKAELQTFPILPSKCRYIKVNITLRYGQMSEVNAKAF